MTHEDNIREDLNKALKEKKEIEVSVLRMVFSAIQEKEKKKRYDLYKKISDEKELEQQSKEKPILKYRTPQPRKRKVSVYDLVDALEKALEYDQKRYIKKITAKGKKITIPKKDKDMTVIINDLYKKIEKTLSTVKKVKFSQLLKTEEREEKIYTFVPLLYLDTQRRIDIAQETHFEDITIHLSKLKKSLAVAE